MLLKATLSLHECDEKTSHQRLLVPLVSVLHIQLKRTLSACWLQRGEAAEEGPGRLLPLQPMFAVLGEAAAAQEQLEQLRQEQHALHLLDACVVGEAQPALMQTRRRTLSQSLLQKWRMPMLLLLLSVSGPCGFAMRNGLRQSRSC